MQFWTLVLIYADFQNLQFFTQNSYSCNTYSKFDLSQNILSKYHWFFWKFTQKFEDYWLEISNFILQAVTKWELIKFLFWFVSDLLWIDNGWDKCSSQILRINYFHFVKWSFLVFENVNKFDIGNGILYCSFHFIAWNCQQPAISERTFLQYFETKRSHLTFLGKILYK